MEAAQYRFFDFARRFCLDLFRLKSFLKLNKKPSTGTQAPMGNLHLPPQKSGRMHRGVYFLLVKSRDRGSCHRKKIFRLQPFENSNAYGIFCRGLLK